ncbi:hypothetical protein HHK36_018142 [Tetracentron sinense]|uniref:BHLH domain-containing protein n=1 Tax=Tetracentron sinense TaxID=13715 RepID=A0A834Z1R1_TETSI|nr:hypothetical protein HHK36_018142 [Tetracentron sinense]
MERKVFDISLLRDTNFGFHDFINIDTNFEQFIDLFSGENPDPVTNFNPNYLDADLMFNGGLVDNQICPTPGDFFDFNSMTSSDPNSILNTLPPFSGDVEGGDEENDGNDSSATTTTPTKRATGDRSRTLISERRRRGRMKEKLYNLRSLVPNITKMDKASIVGDAVLYVQELQKQAKKLRAEIAGLESSLKGGSLGYQDLVDQNPKKTQLVPENKHPICKKIVQMDVFQVEERGFYVRLVCNKGEGVVAALYMALESLPCFDVQSSNFATVSERFVLTCTLNGQGEYRVQMASIQMGQINELVGDRSRTLISERRRRGRMKEKLYNLRSLVPNITKMDKASIVGDAVLYVQELQKQAKKLRAEIAGLESSLKGGSQGYQDLVDQNPKKTQLVPENKHPICKKIVQMDVFQVEERGFYVRLVCNKGEGVVAALYMALESLPCFDVQSSNFATVSERFVLTCTLNVRDCGEEMNLSTLKLWVTGALLNQGFEFKTSIAT